MNDFKGEAKALDEFDIPMLAHRINVSQDHLQAFLNVESRSRGFDRQGRPVILFEPHIFYRLLKGEKRDQAVAAGLAYPKWGEKPYPKESYTRMNAAVKIDRAAALMSASWGSTQILGQNYAMIGYQTPEQMVMAFMDDEEAHVEGMVNYILATGIDDDLRNEDWRAVARAYNGPGYAKNNYHNKMAAEFAKLRGVKDVEWMDDSEEVDFMVPMGDDLRTIQSRLRELGYLEVGKADGIWGTRTRAAVMAFQADNELPIVPGIYDEMMKALMLAGHRQIDSARADATAADLRKDGSRTIAAADKGTAAGVLVGLGGGLTALTDALSGAQEQLDGVTGLIGQVDGLLGSVEGLNGWLLLALGAYMIYQQFLVKESRVDDHRTGKNAGPS